MKKVEQNWRGFFEGKKITQMGLGLLGRGVGDAVFLAKCGAKLVITDLKSEQELAPSIEKLKSYKLPATSYVLGEHRLEDFSGRDFILKAAGVPLDSPYIAEARKNGIPIEMDASLFVKLAPKGVKIIGVTGTRGKTTTTTLIYEIIKKFIEVRPQAAKRGLTSPAPRVFLAGNIKDTATLPLLKKVKEGDYVVIELDSWQLQGFGEAKISPNVAVFTTFYPDHMNYYGGSMEKYFEDKANIFKYQKSGGYLIVGEGIPEAAALYLETKFPSRAVVARAEDVPEEWRLKLPGEHNCANVACAILAARALKIPEKIIREAVENFAGVPGRLELIREINGVKIYNDTTATTPEATLAALRALSGFGHRMSKELDIGCPTEITSHKLKKGKRIILVAGGADKGLDMSKLMKEIPKYCKAVFLLPGTGTEKLRIMNYELGIMAKDLKEAIKKAMELAKKGDAVLFSPAFASFGMFKNEYDREEQFVEIVKNF